MTSPQYEDEGRSANAADRRTKVRDLLFKAAGGITDMADKETDQLDEIYRDWFMEQLESCYHYQDSADDLFAKLRAAVSKEMGNAKEGK